MPVVTTLLTIGALTGCSQNGERTTPVVQPAVVPTLTGLAPDEAFRQAAAAGLRVAVLNPSASPSSCPTPVVAAQGDAPGAQLVRGSEVELTVRCP